LVLGEQLEIGKQGLFLLSTKGRSMELLLEVDQISNAHIYHTISLSIGNNIITSGNIKGDKGGDEIKSLNINVPPKKVSWADVVIGKK
jgi:hypothetical protein